MTCASCGDGRSSESRPAATNAAPIFFEDSAENIISELEDRVQRNPSDFVAFTKLSGYYLQRVRETGNHSDLHRAERAARASLAILPAERNHSALAALAQVESASHNFNQARDHALLLTQYDPGKGLYYQLLGDALIELGDYDGASKAFATMEQLMGAGVTTETRMSRLAFLRGETEVARSRLSSALDAALAQNPASRETVAWCWWQRGELEFLFGEYMRAERFYSEALNVLPNYSSAVASLGRVRAALGDLSGAIEHCERAVTLQKAPTFIALLGDLYKLSGRDQDAIGQYKVAEQEGQHDKLHARHLALFYADHDLKPEKAYALAANDYRMRQDIYAADSLAWTALKAGHLTKAQVAIKEALRLGTKDPRLLYHAGVIARAAKDTTAARDYLNRALKLSPHFDPLQASVARKALEELDQ